MKKTNLFISLILGLCSLTFISVKEQVKTNAEITPANYYDSITSSMKGDTLKVALYNIIKNHTQYSYKSLEVAMKLTDRNWELSPNENDSDPYMVLLYADYNETNPQKWSKSQGSFGTTTNYIWNKEHIWAKSNGFDSQGAMAFSDLHHLRASDWKLNNYRSNNPFNYVTSGKYVDDAFGHISTCKNGSSVFEPSDQYKGDVARALFYMATRYYNGDGSTGTHLALTEGTDSSGGKWGYLNTLLEWHELDPVDEFESHRNDLVYTLQNNRNPYIDHPEYARAVFKNEPIVEPKQVVSLALSGTPTKTTYKEGESFNSSGLTIIATFDDQSSLDVTSNMTWNPSPLVAGTTSVIGTYQNHSVTVNGLIVENIKALELSGAPSKIEYEEGEEFISSGLSVYATYDHFDPVDVTSSVVWTPSPLTEGTTSVTGTYGSKTVTVNGITVKAKEAQSCVIEFKKLSSDESGVASGEDLINFINSGNEYVSSIDVTGNVYKGKSGIKFGSSKAEGKITINLSSLAKGSCSGAKFTFQTYSTDASSVNITTNYDSKGATFAPTNVEAEYSYNTKGSITSITIEVSKRAYLSKVEILLGKETTVVPVDNISIDKSTINLDLNGKTTEQLVASIIPSNATDKIVMWESTNNNVCTVNNGLITAVGVGTTTVTATSHDGGFDASCTVTVINSTPTTVSVESVSLNDSSLTLEIGDIYTLNAVVLPNNATNKNVSWSSSKEDVATISDGVITAISEGTTIITVTTEDGGHTASCEITVNGEPTIHVTSISLDFSSIVVRVGATFQLTATINPTNAANQNVRWSSNNENIASVSDDGLVSGINGGEAIITVISEDGDYMAQCVVTVKDNGSSKITSDGCSGNIITTSSIISILSMISVLILFINKYKKRKEN